MRAVHLLKAPPVQVVCGMNGSPRPRPRRGPIRAGRNQPRSAARPAGHRPHKSCAALNGCLNVKKDCRSLRQVGGNPHRDTASVVIAAFI